MKECKLCHENREIKERGLCNDCSIYSDEQILKEELSIKIIDAERDLEYARRGYLKQFGWEHSCGFPGGYWLWVKVVRGETIAVPTGSAISIEKSIEHYKN